MMYSFGSKCEGLVIAKNEVNGFWLPPNGVLAHILKWYYFPHLEERKTDKSLTLLSQLSVYHTPA